MKYTLSTLGLAVAASAGVVRTRSSQCCTFDLKVHGGVNGTLGFLSDGQARVGPATTTPDSYCISNGTVTDSTGNSCGITDAYQFQCGSAPATSGFSITSSGEFEYNKDSTFYACPVDDYKNYNIYTAPIANQPGCVEVELTSSGDKCAAVNATSSCVASTVTIPAQTVTSWATTTVQGAAVTNTKTVEVTETSTKTVAGPTVTGTTTQYSTEYSTQTVPTTVYSTQEELSTVYSNIPTTVYSTQEEVSTAYATVSEVETTTDYKTEATTAYQTDVETTTQAVPTTAYETEVSTKAVPTTAYETQTAFDTTTEAVPTTAYETEISTKAVPTTAYETEATTVSTTNYQTETSTKAVPTTAYQTVSVSAAPSSSSSTPSSSSSYSASSTSSAAQSSSTCPGDLTQGGYTAPGLIIPIDSSSPDSAYGTQYDAYVNSTTSTIFTFDVPANYTGKQCTLSFFFPTQSQLETSSFTESGNGSVAFKQLSSGTSESTTYNTAPTVTKTLGTESLAPGNAYSFSIGECSAGETLTYEMVSSGSYSLEYFQDYNPCPIGLWVIPSN